VSLDKPTGDAAAVQGVWEWDPDDPRADASPQVLLERVVFAADTLTFHYHRTADGKRTTSPNTFQLHPGSSPKRIDFTPVAGTNKGRTYRGLYEVADGKLRICYRGPDSTRPTDFDDRSDGPYGTMFIAFARPKVAR
jgi:uncharacterized protein (TIGR03067 family)